MGLASQLNARLWQAGCATDLRVLVHGDLMKSSNVMRAAAVSGTHIPKLCATDNMKSFGSCRLCLVEIEGRHGSVGSMVATMAGSPSVVSGYLGPSEEFDHAVAEFAITYADRTEAELIAEHCDVDSADAGVVANGRDITKTTLEPLLATPRG